MTRADNASRIGIAGPQFVGRQRECAALAETLGGGPAVVLIEGEGGIGKSRLVQEFLASATLDRCTSLLAVCPPLQEPFTLGPIVEAARHARDGVADLALSALAGTLRTLFPEWVAELPPALDAPDDAKAARHRLFRALAELIGKMGITLLIVEDLHWADEATLEFLLFLAARQHTDPMSMLLTYRPTDVPAGSQLLRLSSRTPPGVAQLRLALEPLDDTATGQLVSSMLDEQRVSSSLVAFLQRYTDGLPLAIEESVRLLHDRADLIRRQGAWVRRGVGELRAPPTVRDSVVERVQRLSPAAQRLLQVASVLVDAADIGTLASVGDLDANETDRGTADALDSGLLRQDDAGRLSVQHMLTASAVYESIPHSTRRIMHCRAAQVIEGVSPPALHQLARHYRLGNDLAKWAHYAERAADLAIGAGDSTTAITLLDDLVRRADLPGEQRVRLGHKLGLAALNRKTVMPDLTNRVVDTLRVVVDTPGISAASRGRLRNPLGRLVMQAGDNDTGRIELQAALPHLVDPFESARVMLFFGWPRGTPWPLARHLHWLRRAAGVPIESISSFDRLELTVYRTTALLLLGQEDGWQAATEIPADAKTVSETAMVARGYLNTGHAAVVWGRYDEARRRLRLAGQFAQSIDFERLMDDVAITEAHLDWFTGAWDDLDARLRALSEADDAEPPNQLEIAIVAGRLAAATGDDGTAVERLTFAVDEAGRQASYDELMEPAAALAMLHLQHGRIDEAVTATDEAVRVLVRKGVWTWATELAPARVEALLAARRTEDAHRLVQAFARGIRGRATPAAGAALTLCRAVLAQDRQTHERAATLFGRAAAAWRELPRPYDALRADERRARSLTAAGAVDTGYSSLTAVAAGYCALGARADSERVARLIAGAPKRRGRRGYGNNLSPRELEVVRLVTAGRTNREIAESLCRSPRTIATQLHSAMRKLDVSTRTALAVRALEAGVLEG